MSSKSFKPEQPSERQPPIADHFDQIASVIEYANEALQSLKDIMKELDDNFADDMKYNRMTEYTTQLEDCLYSMEKGLSTLRTNFYIDPNKKLPRDRIDYVYPSVDEGLK